MNFYEEVITSKGNTHRFSYLISFPGLDPDSKRNLQINMAEMLDEGEDIRTVKQDTYQARINLRGRVSMGYIRGQRIDAIVETEKGKSTISLIVLNNFNPSLN